MAHIFRHRPPTCWPALLVLTSLFMLLAPVPAAWAVFGDDSNTTARLDEGTIGTITVQGNARTSTALVQHLMGLHVGGPFSPDRLDRAWDALEDCGYFRFVEIEYDDEDLAAVVLTVVVEEDLTTYYGPMLRYDRRHKYALGGWLEERNLRGRGETLRLEAAALYLQQASLSWHRPWLFGVDGLAATLAAGGEMADFVYRPYRYRTWTTDLHLRWDLAVDFFVAGGAAYGHYLQREGYNETLPDRGPDGPVGSVFSPARGDNRWALTATAGYDSRDNPYYPGRGLFGQVTMRNWQSNDWADYTETLADLRAFVPLPWRHQVLAVRAWGRQVDGPVNLDNALFFGGPETVRGYRYASREGEHGYLLSAEYRIPLFLMQISPKGEMVGFGFHFFGDAGDAWYDGAEAGVAQMSYGAGAHVNLDTWQFRFEAARTREGVWQFEFMDRFNF